MYHPTIIQKNLNRAERIIRERYKLSPKWRWQEPSEDEWQTMDTHFATLLDDKGKLTRELTEEEQLWRFCESQRVKLDFHYYTRRYVKILDWSGQLVSFRPNVAQRIFLDIVGEAEQKYHAQMYQILKARQEGFTTIFQILLSHRIFFHRNVNAITGSASEKKSKKMVQKVEKIWQELPWWMRPRRTSFESGERSEFGDLGSGLWVQWGNQKSGIGRGDTATVAHLSELASFENPEDLVDSSLARAMHENPFALLGLESTAEGLGNWWHRTWQTMVDMDAEGLARYKPLFFPWYVAKDIYPTKGWLRRRPIPEGWEVPEHIERHADAARAYVKGSKILSKYLGDGWEMPREQKWFYHVEYLEATKKKTLGLFLQEMPATPEEAFQASNPSVFPIEVLTRARTEANASTPEWVGQIGGRDVSPAYDFYGPSIGQKMLRCYRPNHEVKEEFELNELVLRQWPETETDGKVFVWEWPRQGEEYGIGVDPSEGVGGDGDDAVITVIKKATPQHPDIQVAEWASNRVGPHDLWAWVYALAHLYTTLKPKGGYAYPLVVIETNIAAGDATQTEMTKRGWPMSALHFEQDLTKPLQNARAMDRGDVRLGWRTTRANRPKALSLFRKMVRDGSFVAKSPALVNQMATLEYNTDKQRIAAAAGNHDDRVLASAILLCSWYDPDVRGERGPQAWEQQQRLTHEIGQRPAYRSGVIGGSAPKLMPSTKVADGRSLYTLLK